MGTFIGSRHRCNACGSEIIVTADESHEELAVTCCGAPLEMIFVKQSGPSGSGEPGSAPS